MPADKKAMKDVRLVFKSHFFVNQAGLHSIWVTYTKNYSTTSWNCPAKDISHWINTILLQVIEIQIY